MSNNSEEASVQVKEVIAAREREMPAFTPAHYIRTTNLVPSAILKDAMRADVNLANLSKRISELELHFGKVRGAGNNRGYMPINPPLGSE